MIAVIQIIGVRWALSAESVVEVSVRNGKGWKVAEATGLTRFRKPGTGAKVHLRVSFVLSRCTPR